MKIVLSMALALFLVGCGAEEKKQEVHKNVEPKTEVKQEVQKVNSKTVEVEPVKTEVVPKEIQKIVTADVLFKKCSACHGANAEKKALGKSQIIKGWEVAKIKKALHGYKDGTYGGAMKGLMKGQVSNLSDSNIEEIAKYISKL